MNTQSQQVFSEGQDANFAGSLVTENPHSPSSYLCAYWIQGWKSAQQLREEWESLCDHNPATSY